MRDELTYAEEEQVEEVFGTFSKLSRSQQLVLHPRITKLAFSGEEDAAVGAYIGMSFFGLILLVLIIACGPETIRWFIEQLAQWRHI